MMNLRFQAIFLVVAVLISEAGAMVSKSSRRAFLNQSGLAGALAFGLAPGVAQAYERRDVGVEGQMSADTYAYNIQAYKTNNRLEAEGFKLDTREEEQARLSAAMASFSYDSATSKKKTGYASNASKSAKPAAKTN